ncbi:MAG: type I restriction enzyme HsdR N-terminal domain-containing protein [Elusimicrobiota bacterium]|jgi:predicted type IV restriction endonuclease|nr:type I restriction enzyme HsdR N-terminal domain-containing protein [Elusimicrobiota bacterium]
MASIPPRVEERITKGLQKFQKVLKAAKDKDLNESDTVVIIADMLADIFGYDKYSEVTSELAIKGTFCDLAIKVEDKFQFIIECKSIGTDLKEHHLKQAVDYGANKGISWVALTNGALWEVHKIRFEQPISTELVCAFDIFTLSYKKKDDIEKLFVLCKEGLSKDHREEFYEKVQLLNKYMLGAFILQEPVLSTIRRELKKYAVGLKVENEDIDRILRDEVLRRELLEGENAEKSLSKIKKYYQKINKQSADKKKETAPVEETPEQPNNPDTLGN